MNYLQFFDDQTKSWKWLISIGAVDFAGRTVIAGFITYQSTRIERLEAKQLYQSKALLLGSRMDSRQESRRVWAERSGALTAKRPRFFRFRFGRFGGWCFYCSGTVSHLGFPAAP